MEQKEHTVESLASAVWRVLGINPGTVSELPEAVAQALKAQDATIAELRGAIAKLTGGEAVSRVLDYAWSKRRAAEAEIDAASADAAAARREARIREAEIEGLKQTVDVLTVAARERNAPGTATDVPLGKRTHLSRCQCAAATMA